MLRMSACLLGGALTMTAWAQPGEIRWRTDAREAVQEAQSAQRPLMVYVLASTHDRDEKIEREQRRALSDPRVVMWAQHFIPLRLSRSSDREVLDDFGLPESANMVITFVGPDGKRMDDISALGISQADSLVQKMSAVHRQYTKQIYDRDVEPVLKDADAKSADLRAALLKIREYGMTDADGLVILLLERPQLEREIRKLAYQVLGELSTKNGTTKLIDWAWDGDADALDALGRGTPAAAEQMLEELKPEAEEFPYPLYQAITKICRVPKPKPERFFEKGNQKLKAEEIERVKKVVATAAREWREANGQMR